MLFFFSSHSRAENWMKNLPGTGGWEKISDLVTDYLRVELVHFKRIRNCSSQPNPVRYEFLFFCVTRFFYLFRESYP